MKNRYFLLFFLALIFSKGLTAQKSTPDTLIAIPAEGEITLDGILDEESWLIGIPVSNFTQREQNEGEPPTEKTEVIIIYNTNNLYIGMRAFDSEPEKITARQMQRDFAWSTDDNFEILLSTFNDNRSGYLFVINPNGARADALVINEGTMNKDWNGVWYTATSRTEDGWFAEIRIPFSTLKFPDVVNHIWGLNMERNIRRKKEQLLWQGWSIDYNLEQISQGGKLVGLMNIEGLQTVEFKPYGIAGMEKMPDENMKYLGNVGGELNYQISPTMKLNLTINTDFSQVESDRAQVNLSRFSISYPEKREFFLEGKNTFESNLGGSARIFHSRTIGIHKREEVPILGGARLLGKAGKTSIGLLSMQTSEKDTLPTTNYSVIRIRQDVLNQSDIGVIVTTKNNGEHHNHVLGLDANYVTSKIFGDKNFEFGGSVTGSYTSGITNKDNLAYQAYLGFPNDLVEYNLSMTGVQDEFNPEMGFLRRKNYKVFNTELSISPRPKSISWIQQLEFVPFELSYYLTDNTNELESVYLEIIPLAIEFKSGEQFEFNIQRLFDRLDEPFEIVDEVEIEEDEFWNTQYELQFESYSGRDIVFESAVDWGEFYTGTRMTLENSVEFDIGEHFNMSADWERNRIDLPEGSFVTDEIGGRMEYEFTTNLNTSLYGQWNNEDDEVVLNFRINWIPQIGSDFYFVINQLLNTEGNKVRMEKTTILAKLIWRFAG